MRTVHALSISVLWDGRRPAYSTLKLTYHPPYHPPGDEGGESELLGEDLPLEPSVAKAERSHLIVWQVMYGSE